MAEQSAFDPKSIQLQTLGPPPGLLEQFNLPPRVIKFIRRNQRTLWMVVIGCVSLAVAISAYTSYRHYRAGKAVSALDAALVASQERRPLLTKVVEEYGNTPSGRWARIELAFLDEKAGQTAQAITELAAVNATLAPQDPLKPLILTKLGALHEDQKQFDQALLVYGDLANIEGFGPEATRALGRVNEQLGRPAEALAAYSQYLEMTKAEKAKADPVREMVQSRINQLKK